MTSLEFTAGCRVYLSKSKMAAPRQVPDSEVTACLNEVKRINIYRDADAEALTEVIVDYFTSGHASDSDIIHEGESDESHADPMAMPVPIASDRASGLSGAVTNIDEGTKCDVILCTYEEDVYLMCKKKLDFQT